MGATLVLRGLTPAVWHCKKTIRVYCDLKGEGEDGNHWAKKKRK